MRGDDAERGGHIWGWAASAAAVKMYVESVIPLCQWAPTDRFLGGQVSAVTLDKATCSGCLVKLDEILAGANGHGTLDVFDGGGRGGHVTITSGTGGTILWAQPIELDGNPQ